LVPFSQIRVQPNLSISSWAEVVDLEFKKASCFRTGREQPTIRQPDRYREAHDHASNRCDTFIFAHHRRFIRLRSIGWGVFQAGRAFGSFSAAKESSVASIVLWIWNFPKRETGRWTGTL